MSIKDVMDELDKLRAANAQLTSQCDEWMATATKGVTSVIQMSDLFQKIRDRLVPASSKGENHGEESTGEQAWPPPPLLEIIDSMKEANAQLTKERDEALAHCYDSEGRSELTVRRELEARVKRYREALEIISKADSLKSSIASFIITARNALAEPKADSRDV